MSNLPTSISGVAAQTSRVEDKPIGNVFKEVTCPLLSNVEGTDMGRKCKLKRLNFREQLKLLGRVSDAVATDAKSRAEGDEDAPASDDESNQFWESCWLLVLGCVEPAWTLEEAIQWLTLDEMDGVNCADVVGWLLHHIREWNSDARGLEDVSMGLQTIAKFPGALQKLEVAYLKGGNALDLLLEGKSPNSQDEMVEFIEKWGDIISEIVLRSVRKKARIEAEEASTALVARMLDAMVQCGYLEREGDG